MHAKHMWYSARLVVWFAKKGEKKDAHKTGLILDATFVCIHTVSTRSLFLSCSTAAMVYDLQVWFSVDEWTRACEKKKITCIGYRTIWIYLFTLHLLLTGSCSSHHLLHRMQMRCRKVWSEQRRTWFAYTFATRRPTVYMYMEIIQEDKEKIAGV